MMWCGVVWCGDCEISDIPPLMTLAGGGVSAVWCVSMCQWWGRGPCWAPAGSHSSPPATPPRPCCPPSVGWSVTPAGNPIVWAVQRTPDHLSCNKKAWWRSSLPPSLPPSCWQYLDPHPEIGSERRAGLAVVVAATLFLPVNCPAPPAPRPGFFHSPKFTVEAAMWAFSMDNVAPAYISYRHCQQTGSGGGQSGLNSQKGLELWEKMQRLSPVLTSLAICLIVPPLIHHQPEKGGLTAPTPPPTYYLLARLVILVAVMVMMVMMLVLVLADVCVLCGVSGLAGWWQWC